MEKHESAAVVQKLLTLDKYKELQLDGRLKGFDFGGMTRLAIRDGKDIKKRTKELMKIGNYSGRISLKTA